MRSLILTVLLLFFLAAPVFQFVGDGPIIQTTLAQASPTPTPLPPPTVNINDYRVPAGRIIGAALTNPKAFQRLGFLTDNIGHRLSGTQSLDRAIQWALAEMKKDGLDNVRLEKVMVPHWVRGKESLEMLVPTSQPMTMLGLGHSIATPPEGITADAVVVRNFDELDALGEKVRGKMVVCNAVFTTYNQTVIYRGYCAIKAAKYGAVAALVRSITPTSLDTAHTGSFLYDDSVPKIPSAAITLENADLMQRLYDRGEKITLRLKMDAKLLPDVESANVIGEIKGTTKPDEIVLIGGHIDSWDVGQGAQDDGGGIIQCWEALRLLKELGLRPRRTIRVVMFTNEEDGTKGGLAYRDAHKNELAKHILAMETDTGTYKPYGIGLAPNATPQARSNMQAIAKLLTGIGADTIGPTGGGADIDPIVKEGVLGSQLDVDMSTYFDIHHTWADTLDKVDPQDLAYCIATIAVMSYVVADMPQSLSGGK